MKNGAVKWRSILILSEKLTFPGGHPNSPTYGHPKLPHLERWYGRLIRGAGRRDVMLLSHQHEGGRSERLEITFADHHRDAAQQRRGAAGDRAAYRGGSQDHPALRTPGSVARGAHRL